MPNTGRNTYEMINDNESTEEYIPLRREETPEMANHDPDTLVGTTQGGKKLYISKHPNNAGYYFKFVPGGQLPKDLNGLWLTFHVAERQAKVYLANDAEKAAAKTKTEKVKVEE